MGTKEDKVINKIFVLFLIVFPVIALADNATCTIKIYDVNNMNSYNIEFKYEYENEGDRQSNYFELPGTSEYACMQAFFDLETGTMISCEYRKDEGYTFFQSDRSGLDENDENRLTFRHGTVFVDIQSNCK